MELKRHAVACCSSNESHRVRRSRYEPPLRQTKSQVLAAQQTSYKSPAQQRRNISLNAHSHSHQCPQDLCSLLLILCSIFAPGACLLRPTAKSEPASLHQHPDAESSSIPAAAERSPLTPRSRVPSLLRHQLLRNAHIPNSQIRIKTAPT